MSDLTHGKLIIFSGPSGTGKTTIVHHLLETFDLLEFSISATTRPKREGEQDGVDYYFLSVKEFKAKIRNEEFIEYEEVYENVFYGTLKSELERIWAKGHHVVFDVDVAGGVNIKHQYPDRALSVFIRPPSVETLEKRLLQRLTEGKESRQKRLSKAQHELEYEPKYDRTIVNQSLNPTLKEAEEIVKEFLKG